MKVLNIEEESLCVTLEHRKNLTGFKHRRKIALIDLKIEEDRFFKM